MPYCTVVRAIYIYCPVVALITTHCLLSPCSCVLSYKPVNAPQAGLYEYNALVRNHKYIQPSGFALVLYVLVVTHSCIILHTAQLGVVSCPDPLSGGCGEREKEGLGNNPGWKCPGGMLWLRNN